MDRVETLCDKLKQQIEEKGSIDDLLRTVQMLESELLHLKSNQQITPEVSAVAFHIASSGVPEDLKITELIEEEEKVVLQLQLEESELENELEEIRKNAEIKNNIATFKKPPVIFNPLDETPTLSQQKSKEESSRKELNEAMADDNQSSLNERLATDVTAVSDTLKDSPIKDLKKAIGINDRFFFINELFKGDEVMYERSIKTINGFSIYPEAEYWIRRELKLKLGWNERLDAVKQFDQLVKRRFSFT
jgi:hypothetical protein